MLASRRSTAAVVGPIPHGMKQSGFTVCELLVSARSGGGRDSGASRELACIAQTRGTPHPVLPSDASRRAPSSERDAATLVAVNDQSNESDTCATRVVGKLLMGAAQTTRQAPRYQHNSHAQKSSAIDRLHGRRGRRANPIHVRFWPEADIARAGSNVRFGPKCGHHPRRALASVSDPSGHKPAACSDCSAVANLNRVLLSWSHSPRPRWNRGVTSAVLCYRHGYGGGSQSPEQSNFARICCVDCECVNFLRAACWEWTGTASMERTGDFASNRRGADRCRTCGVRYWLYLLSRIDARFREGECRIARPRSRLFRFEHDPSEDGRFPHRQRHLRMGHQRRSRALGWPSNGNRCRIGVRGV